MARETRLHEGFSHNHIVKYPGLHQFRIGKEKDNRSQNEPGPGTQVQWPFFRESAGHSIIRRLPRLATPSFRLVTGVGPKCRQKPGSYYRDTDKNI